MKANPILPALLAAFITIPASALTWNDAGPTNNWSTAVGNTNWTGGVTWTNGSAADFTGAGETVTLATAAMTAGTVTFSAGAYTLNTNGNSMAWNALAGTAGFTKSGAGTLTINGTGGASGTINLTGGQITVGGTTALGTTSIAADGGSTVLAANGYNIANAVSLANGAKLSTTAGSTVSSSISLGAGGGNLSGGAGNYGIFTGKITGGTAGTNSLTINAGHTELKNTANDFAGNILLSGGFYLKTTISESLPDNAIINFTNANAAYKIQPGSAGTYTETIGGINSAVGAFGVFAEGSVPGVIVNLRVGAGDATSSYNGPIFQVGQAVLNFEKIGAGTFTSAGTNTYTGNTTVNAGTLAVTRSLGATAVTVNSPATLAGNGNIGGNVTIASGAHHALAVAATTGAQITRAITGTLTMTDSILDLTAASTPAAGVYVLATATTAITGTPATINYNAISGTVSVDTVSSPHRLLLTVVGSPPVGDPLIDALTALKSHITGSITLSNSQIEAHYLTINTEKGHFADSSIAIAAAFDLVTTYDTVLGPLFVARSLPARSAVTNDLHWTLYTLMQDLIDLSYSEANLATYPSLFNGFKFGSSASFPGACAPPADPNLTHTATLSATYLNTAGRDTIGDGPGTFARKPTGTYLAPGTIATVIVPAALVNTGYKIRVGAHSWDMQATNRQSIKRLDRASIVYDITATTTKIASPLGGGIYIEVPWLANAGTVSVQIKGAVRSPYFSAKSIQTTTPTQWLTERENPAPWADFQTDKFMMQVPTSWISAMPDPTQVMADWDASADATNDLMGFPRVCGKETLYLQVDVELPYPYYASGYPAVNNRSFVATNTYNGYNSTSYFIRGPKYFGGDRYTLAMEFHEKGHGYLFPRFNNEEESAINLLYVPVLNQKFGLSLDEAFRSSLGYTNAYQTLDTTAMAWMTVFNFSPRKAPMAPSEKNYQLKGHAKWVDIARLFGWGKLRNFWLTTVEEANGTSDTATDSVILRLSTAVGKDVRPLLNFWGIYPDDPTALGNAITAAGLTPSREIYNALLHYKSLVPANNAAFQSFALSWWGRQPSIKGGWEEREHARQWDTAPLYSAGDQQRSEATNPGEIYNENSANDIRNRIQEILDLYYPSGIPADNTPPVVLTLSAPDDSVENSVSANLVATFTKAIVIGTGNITLKNLTDATQSTIAITDASQVSVAGPVLTLNPTANLLASKTYAIRIATTAIDDTAGNSFAGISNDTTWNFTTQSANSGLFTWDGSTDFWTSAHWNAGAGLVSGPVGNDNHNSAAINGGTVTFASNDTFGNAASMSSPVITINSGGTLVSGGYFNTIWDLTVNGGTLLANGGVNDPFAAFALKGTVNIGGNAASNISVGTGSFNTVSLGTSTGGSTTFNVGDVSASTAPDLTISTVLNNNSNVASGLIKTGAGTLLLTGVSTYTGNTTVNAGTLAVTGSLGATTVTVNSPATLAGNGNIGGNVTIASGARHALAVAATTGAQITRAITGTLTMTDSILDLTAASTPAAGVYVLATATTAITGTPATINYNAISGTVSVDTVSSPHRLLLTVSGSPYDTWANGTFANPFTNKLPTANPDADGQTNQQEFAFGLDPTTGSSVNPITQQLAGGVFKYTRTKDSGLIYKVYYSTALSSWTWDEFATQSPAAAVAGVETVTVTLAAAAPIDGKLFVRVEAAPAP